MESNTKLRKSVSGTDIDAEDYAKKMVELVEKRRREIREQSEVKVMEKESLKSSGKTLQGAEKKKQKVLDVEDIPILESAKFVKEEKIEIKQPVLKISRRKSKAESGEVDITSSKIVKWKILRHGGKGYYHLIRANQRDSVFANFGAMLHNISRNDLVNLYKIVLQKTTAYGPEEDLERAFAENLMIMFDPP
ncbi:hypothetical protein Tco_1064506 [Tanacetum coccineum]